MGSELSVTIHAFRMRRHVGFPYSSVSLKTDSIFETNKTKENGNHLVKQCYNSKITAEIFVKTEIRSAWTDRIRKQINTNMVNSDHRNNMLRAIFRSRVSLYLSSSGKGSK